MKVEIYYDEEGFSPYYYWLLGENLWELRMVFGGGIRVYYGLRGNDVVLLLGGGKKSTQERNIKKARLLWQRFLETNK